MTNDVGKESANTFLASVVIEERVTLADAINVTGENVALSNVNRRKVKTTEAGGAEIVSGRKSFASV
jgi:hypothetical protein